jgi:hypothetical protein
MPKDQERPERNLVVNTSLFENPWKSARVII